jgi:hypothetical protein
MQILLYAEDGTERPYDLPPPLSTFLVLPESGTDRLLHYKLTHRHDVLGREVPVYVFDHAQTLPEGAPVP